MTMPDTKTAGILNRAAELTQREPDLSRRIMGPVELFRALLRLVDDPATEDDARTEGKRLMFEVAASMSPLAFRILWDRAIDCSEFQ